MTAVLKQAMGIEKVIAVEVDHCPQSYACLLVGTELGPGQKAIYSGDTRPCQNFVNYAQGASILIHEATLGAGMEEEAKAKKHTSTQEALDVIAQTKPWRAILTHFSPRYKHLSEILPGHKELKVMIAVDHLRLSLSQLEFAYKYLDLLQAVFGEDDEVSSDESAKEIEQKSQPSKRQKK